MPIMMHRRKAVGTSDSYAGFPVSTQEFEALFASNA